SVLDSLLGCSTPYIQEIGGLAARELYYIHRSHGQSGAVYHTADVSVELDVVQIVLRCLNFERLFFIEVPEVGIGFMPEQGIVIEVHFGIQRIELAILSQEEWVDF